MRTIEQRLIEILVDLPVDRAVRIVYSWVGGGHASNAWSPGRERIDHFVTLLTGRIEWAYWQEAPSPPHYFIDNRQPALLPSVHSRQSCTAFKDGDTSITSIEYAKDVTCSRCLARLAVIEAKRKAAAELERVIEELS